MGFKRWLKRKHVSGRRGGGGTVAKAGYVLALVSGLVIIILSLAAILHFPLSLPFTSLAGYFGLGIITLILGIVTVIGSKRVNEVLWAVALMVIGFLGGGVGGLLALIGGLLGLLSRYV